MVQNKVLSKIALVSYLLFSLLKVYSQQIVSSPQVTLHDQLIISYEDQNFDLLTGLIENNRLKIKPFVDSLCAEIFQLELGDDNEKANQNIKLVEKVAEIFCNCFNCSITNVNVKESFPVV